jgi:DNA-directed RNA polymerase subunit omega
VARITVEDCLKKVPSRFALVHIASERARQLIKGAPAFVKTDNKAVVTALREVASGYVSVAEGQKKRKFEEATH